MRTRFCLVSALCYVFALAPLLAQTQTSASDEKAPPGCKAYDGAKYATEGALWCVVIERFKTGQGTSWGDSKYATSRAPKGYKLRWSETHVSALDHHCGVKDEGDEQPSPFNSDHKRAGESFWAQCIIWERDESHVVVKANIQGWQGNQYFYWDRTTNAPGWMHESDPKAIYGTVTIYAIYWPIK